MIVKVLRSLYQLSLDLPSFLGYNAGKYNL